MVWRRLRNGLTSLRATELLALLGDAPITIEVSGLYPSSPWVFISVVLLMTFVVTYWPTLVIAMALCIPFIAIAESLYRMIRRKSPEPYPRIFDRTISKTE
jgi:hypothetical protein